MSSPNSSAAHLTGPVGFDIAALLPLAGADLVAPLVQGGSITYAGLDVAASAPALSSVVDRINAVIPYYSNVHRGAGFASQVSTDLYETARQTIASFVGARSDDVTIIVRNTTDALNLLASCVPDGGSVVHLDIEHHANLLPWKAHQPRTVQTQRTVAETLTALETELARRPLALLAVTGASNVTGEALPLPDLVAIAHRHGARIAVDAAQLAPHRRIDISALGVDYIAISGHKMYAPFGAGALIGRADWLNAAPPHLAGGGAVDEVTSDSVHWAPAPARHEAGTPNILGAIALAHACSSLAALPPGAQQRHEQALLARLDDGLAQIPGLTTIRIWDDAPDRMAVTSFVIQGWDSSKLATILAAEFGIGVRDGRFCAHPLLARFSPSGTAVRVSLGAGTTSEHVDRLLAALASIVLHGPTWNYVHTGNGWAPQPETRDLNPLGLDSIRSVSQGASPCNANTSEHHAPHRANSGSQSL